MCVSHGLTWPCLTLSIIKFLYWNCRGAASMEFRAVLKDFVSVHQADAVVLAEPKISGMRATRVTQQLGFNNVFRLDAQGFSGGLWLLWKDTLDKVTVVASGCGYIHLRISRRDGCVWFYTFEKLGGTPFDFRRSARFQQWVNDCHLIDLGYSGPKFTWLGHESHPYGRVFERLDHVFGNLAFCSAFPLTTVRHSPRVRSDHHPILVSTEHPHYQPAGEKPFRFELAWTTHPDYSGLLMTYWDVSEALPLILFRWQSCLQAWNRNMFGHIFRRKKQVLARIGGVQRTLMLHPNPFLLHLEVGLQAEYRLISRQETLHWFQKSRVDWLCLGDRNTRFFHASTTVRRRRSRIEALRDDTS
ncbi:hypothetical protein K2173_027862 [Erythroxylum novogranatense]|uniref:Endonuclease/exonuclease/phosphatase domain-containing protein n=1 Tax=Erythroxylum novogranatense TaxID=1862640 RepID=A0AAV8U2S6_9ROSI|nr:hypothetical protein K2173_027862 [Erythroxylum novogranatense]